jgi:TRAP transporter TAXI family solute receptor
MALVLRISRRVALAVGAAALAAAPFAAMAEPASLTLGSTNSASSHYAVAVAMSKAIKKELPNVNVSMIETGASVDNIRRMVKGEIDLGLVMLDTSVMAHEGKGPFQGKAVEDLGVLYVYDSVTLQLAVRADAGISTLKDLQGKKFSAGIRGSGAELLTREMFQVLGIEPQWSPGSIQDAVEGTQNRQLVGYSKYGVGTGLDSTMRELLLTTPMKFLDFSEADRKAIAAKVKGVDFGSIPANTVPGQPEVTTPVVLATYSARIGRMDEPTAYAVAKAIDKNRDLLVDVFPHLKDWNFAQQTLKAEKLGLKLHPGAKKYWEEAR